MLKSLLTATAFTLIAGFANAAQPTIEIAQPATQTAITEDASNIEMVNYYCEWVTVYDAWGNWVTVWQCY
ncbi:hypothetical protein [Pelagovum pacificum]|uniref:Uncharacterized protein n=1 Tax=Pelagovum pacificum TaxID=2588711 RepID=A0A5C5GEN9_9RHOB|nr:hypothetical protein [Pelagovum pacificum]QQA43895.1 hypothetical protein I8N54_04765 [Pelagovum pacificum]QQA43899.1 hypothetical protein I8N54_04785 [Pelagovum pacificum]TNY32970.1 hypothetical protein FHY64_06755 [Pelagovum pacificum]TNY32974.1 hypothetical protein FHY64_06775 [Pelagovum pacificum]